MKPALPTKKPGIGDVGRAADCEPLAVAGFDQPFQHPAMVAREIPHIHGLRSRRIAGVVVALEDQDRIAMRLIQKSPFEAAEPIVRPRLAIR